MGAWSNKPFGNDTALDWVCGLKGDQGEALIDRTVQRACEEKKQLDAGDAEQAVAAAAVIAGAIADPARKVPQDVKSWIRTRGYVPNKALIKQAIKALDVVMTDSELRELWEESESVDAWLKITTDIRDRLVTALKSELPMRKPKKPGMPRSLHKLIERYKEDSDPAVRDKIRQKIDGLHDPNAITKDTGHQTPLTLLAKAGLVEEARRLIDAGADVNLRTQGSGLTPVTAACKNNDIDMLKTLVEAGAELFDEIVIDANSGREMDFVEEKDKAKPIPFRFAQAMYFAARYGDVDLFDYLESQGADIGQMDLNGENLLHKACSGGNLKTIRHLMDRGFDVNDDATYHETPFFNAVRAGHLEAVKLLIEAGADVNRMEHWGGRPLDYAGSNKAVTRILIENGAIPGEERKEV